ncbi:hypothetical protein JX265_011805 [Neoarthrinium moseri]|uniref:Origin recognition complex subunit 2 n=1 Tax=Neoarthrinium moseri TaxID=1658444 RepID=A0A9Q0AH79_9PEZI|nr:uncharacterized protein JN550_013478 [Neoarthrinium moseri]KAI1856090.1 hypothetical protein JX265_011805 [Neoarthrinium moseri]KAI1857034.1 hypothetical protein JN550_013478 [Neoarthrinium moseri]
MAPRKQESAPPEAATRLSTRTKTSREPQGVAGSGNVRARGANSAYEPPKRKRGRPSNASRRQEAAAQEGDAVYDFPSSGDEEGDRGASMADVPIKTANRRTGRAPTAAHSSAAAASAVTDHTSATPKKRKANGPNVTETPSSVSRFKDHAAGETPRWRRNDRSARKKSARALIESVVAGNASDEEDDQGIAREIYESSGDSDSEDLDEDEQVRDANGLESLAATPSKKPRGRRKGSTTRARKKSPTPPRDLPPHELYFAQNRPGASKTSGNSLASLELLTHDEYFSIVNAFEDPHRDDVNFLQEWHTESFPQWSFELAQGFSICLYGYGSKRSLLHNFAKHLYAAVPDHVRSKTVIINGYVRNTSIRDILGTVGSAVNPSYKLPAGNPSAMLDDVKSFLSSHDVSITLVLNSIDATPLRKPGMQAILAQLASHPSIHLICSADTPDFSLLWDTGLRSAFNFVFHDCTTFGPFTVEVDVVDEVHELLGRKARRVGGKEGVTYVLRSLPENAKNLFRLLVTEVLVAMDEVGISSGENPGVEYRMLYGKAVEEFICSSEVAFRTLLKEFHDHQMITSRKDVLGTELLSVPFRKEELETVLEDLMS